MTRPVVGRYQCFGAKSSLNFQGWSNIDLQLNFYSLKMEAPSSSETVVPIIGIPENTVARTVNLAKL
jgi:hypothetical protein